MMMTQVQIIEVIERRYGFVVGSLKDGIIKLKLEDFWTWYYRYRRWPQRGLNDVDEKRGAS
jgi:hypothetical protein